MHGHERGASSCRQPKLGTAKQRTAGSRVAKLRARVSPHAPCGSRANPYPPLSFRLPLSPLADFLLFPTVLARELVTWFMNSLVPMAVRQMFVGFLSGASLRLVVLLSFFELVRGDFEPTCSDKEGCLGLPRVGNATVCNLGVEGTGGSDGATPTLVFHGSWDDLLRSRNGFNWLRSAGSQ